MAAVLSLVLEQQFSSFSILSHALHCSSGTVFCTATPVLCLLGTVFSTSPLGCVLHCPSGSVLCTFPPEAMLCTAPLVLCSHCLFESVLFVFPLGYALHCYLGVCSAPQWHYALH